MSLFQIARSQSQRIEMIQPWGLVVWHRWRCLSSDVKKPLVLLHGGSGSWTHWVNNVLHLSGEHDVWALDLPGFGDSSLPAGVKDSDTLAPYVAHILAHTFPHTPVDLVGFSFGGLTAGFVAASHPELFSKLVLVGVPGLGLMVEDLPMHGIVDGMSDAQRRDIYRHNLKIMMLVNPAHITDEVIDLQMSNVERDRMRRRRLARTDVLTKLQSQWTCPVHGVWGAHDALYANTLQCVPHSLPLLETFHVIPNAGHWVQFENADAFHAVLEKIR